MFEVYVKGNSDRTFVPISALKNEREINEYIQRITKHRYIVAFAIINTRTQQPYAWGVRNRRTQ